MDEGEHLKIWGRLGEDTGMSTYLHSSVDYANTLKCDFGWETWTCQKGEKCVRVVERRKKVDAQNCRRDEAIECRTNT